MWKAVRTTLLVLLGAVAFAIAGMFVLTYYAERHDESVANVQPAVAAVDDGPPISVTADQLFTDYSRNEVRADQTYRGHTLLVAGAVQSIRKNEVTGRPMLEVWTRNEFLPVVATFPDNNMQMTQLNPGDHITLRCVGAGQMMGSPRLKHCWLDSYER